MFKFARKEIAAAPFEYLINLEGYPAVLDQADKKWIYWGRGYEAVSGDDWVVVTINTCHFHGTLLANEYERGRIGESALADLRENLLDLSEKFAFRVVVLHHPPISHEEFGISLGRVPMWNGDLLVKAVEETGKDWLIIHGHKHLHRLVRSSGTEYAPIVFGAASFGALLTGEVSNQTKNQFYILELSFREIAGEYRLRGKLDTLCWDGQRWDLSMRTIHGLPHGCGFDQGGSFRSQGAASAIKSLLIKNDEAMMTWSEVCSHQEELKYLMPKDIQNLMKKLDALGVKTYPGDNCWFPDQLWIGP